MKSKNILLTICIFGCFFCVASFAYVRSNSAEKLKLTIDSSKKIYKLGEVVNLSFSLKNESSEAISILGILGTGDGSLNIDISRNGKDYKNFHHPRWGTVDICCPKTMLEPSESSNTSGSIFWIWAKQDVPGYAFSNSGIYYLKARYSAMIEERKDPILLESEPTQIIIEEPVGEDLEVWNIIKESGDFAYFIQENDFRIPSYKPEERVKFQQKVEQIINQYPNSFYAQSLQQSLTKFRVNEAKRKEFLEKRQKD